MQTIAVLCAEKTSIYKQIPYVDVYDEERDARSFACNVPIVAHPPCRSWSAFCSHQAKPKIGEKDLAPLCVEFLRKCGGVLEHPAHSKLWAHLSLPKPGQPSKNDLWSIHVKQCWWGDSRTKNTWLLFSKIDPIQVDVPLRLHQPQGDRKRWQLMSKTQRSATVPAFAEWLVDLARQTKGKA